MIEVDGVRLRTEREWERAHRHVLRRELARGVTREWASPAGRSKATWYREDQTRPWTDREISGLRRARAAARLEARLDEARRLASSERRRFDLGEAQGRPGGGIDDWCTAFQWVDMGLVPLPSARWRLGDGCSRGRSGEYFYCPPWDVRWSPGRASELLESGPREFDRLPDGRPYDGRPWW